MLGTVLRKTARMKLYTRRGDDGTTGLLGGKRVSKDDVRVRAYGAVDEINATVGWVLAACQFDDITEMLTAIQSDLFVLGAALATADGRRSEVAIGKERVTCLERWIDHATAEVSPLTAFILPGGSELAGRLHLARTVCRRAEREVVHLATLQPVEAASSAYVNRLSDLLFALARCANARMGLPDIPWKKPQT